MTEGLPGTDEPAVARGATAAPASTADAPPAEDVSRDPAPPRQRVKGLERGRRGGLRSPWLWLAWGVALLAIAAAAFFGVQWADLYNRERTREEVRAEATTLAARLTTFTGEDIENWLAEMERNATGEYAEQLDQIFDQQQRDNLRDAQVESVGDVENLYVQDVNGDEATAFAVVTQTYVNVNTPGPVEDHQRMEIGLQRVDGEWLVSSVIVLGPAGVVAPVEGSEPQTGDE